MSATTETEVPAASKKFRRGPRLFHPCRCARIQLWPAETRASRAPLDSLAVEPRRQAVRPGRQLSLTPC
jgi:hypothetical protein